MRAARSGSLFSGSGCSAASHPLIPHDNVLTIATMMITMVSGTAVISLLIVVGVGLDTVKQIESQLHLHSYAGFMRPPANKQKILENDGTPRVPVTLNVS